MKISADGVFSRLEEMEIQKVIKLSQLPLPGKIRAVYQTIGRMPTSTTSNVSVEGLNLKDQLVLSCIVSPFGDNKKGSVTKW